MIQRWAYKDEKINSKINEKIKRYKDENKKIKTIQIWENKMIQK